VYIGQRSFFVGSDMETEWLRINVKRRTASEEVNRELVKKKIYRCDAFNDLFKLPVVKVICRRYRDGYYYND
jgi:hypothetical protein